MLCKWINHTFHSYSFYLVVQVPFITFTLYLLYPYLRLHDWQSTILWQDFCLLNEESCFHLSFNMDTCKNHVKNISIDSIVTAETYSWKQEVKIVSYFYNNIFRIWSNELLTSNIFLFEAYFHALDIFHTSCLSAFKCKSPNAESRIWICTEYKFRLS